MRFVVVLAFKMLPSRVVATQSKHILKTTVDSLHRPSDHYLLNVWSLVLGL